MRPHYFAVRPVSMPDHIRIARATSPGAASAECFGDERGVFEFLDVGTNRAVMQRQRAWADLLAHGLWRPVPRTRRGGAR